MKLTLAGLTWLCLSPSRFELAEQARVTMFYDGLCWRLAFDGEDGPGNFPTRDAAAQAIADGVHAFYLEQMA